MAEKIGLEAVFDDSNFQAGMSRYQNSIRTAESETSRGASGLSATWLAAGAAIAVGINLLNSAVNTIQSALQAPINALTSWANELDSLSDQFGLSGERASAWGYLMNRVGLSVEEGASGLNSFVRQLAQSETALQQASTTYASSVQDITESHADAMLRIAKDWTDSQRDAADKQTEIWAQLAERKTGIEEQLAETIADINSALNRQLAQYAYDREKELEGFTKDAAEIDRNVARDRLEIEEQFQKDIAQLRQDRAKQLEDIQKNLVDSLNNLERDRVKTLFEIERDASRSLERLEQDRTRNLEKLERERAKSVAEVDENAAKTLAELTAQRDRRLAHARSYAEIQSIYEQFNAEQAALEAAATERKKEIEERAAERRAEIEERAAEQRAEIELRKQERIVEAQERAAERKADLIAQAQERKKEAKERARERQQELQEQRTERLQALAEQRAERQKELAERRAEAQIEFDRRVQLAKEESALRIAEAEKSAAKQIELAEKQAAKETEALAKALAKQDTARQEKYDAENKRFQDQTEKLNESLGKAQTANPILAALDKLGVSAFDSAGKLRTFNDLVPEIAQAFALLPPGIEASNISFALFGRSGSKFLDFLRETGKELGDGTLSIDDYTKKLQELGLIMSDEEIEAVQQFQISWNELTLALKGFWVEIGKQVLPLLKDLIEYVKTNVLPAFTQWARDNVPLIIEKLKELAAWVRDDVLPAVQNFIEWVKANWPQFQKTVIDAWNEIKPRLDEFIQWFNTDGKEAINSFLETVRRLQEMVDIVSGVWHSVVGVSTAMMDLFIGVWRAGERLIHGDFLGWGAEIQETAHKVLADLLSIWGVNLDDLTALVHTKIGEILTFFESLPTQFETFGKNMWEGLVRGIESVKDQLSEAFQGPIQTLIDLLNRLLEIGSPSKVFQRMGENMMLGLMQGFTNPRLQFTPNVLLQATQPRMTLPIRNIQPINAANGVSGGARDLIVNFYGTGGPSSQADAEIKTNWMVNALRGKGYDF